ncbi:single Myb histone 3, partial [Tanacetum coccineum]
EYIGKYGSNLRSLALECVENSNTGLVKLSNAGLGKLSEGCPKLRKLELTNCGFSKHVATSFLFNIPSLRISDRFLGGFIVNVELAAAFENRGLVPFALKEYQWLVQNCYRLRSEALNGTRDPTPKPKEIRPRLSPINCLLGETLEEAAVAAAYKVAELVQQIYKRCANGEVVKVQ